MGYLATSKAYRIWNNDLRRINESRDILFDKDLLELDTEDIQPLQWFGIEGEGAPIDPVP